MCKGNKDNNSCSQKAKPAFNQDLNCLPHEEDTHKLTEDQLGDQTRAGFKTQKKERAATKDIAKLSLEDIAKYFDIPIVEASKRLKVGLTVLKRKCREFGIPRWPHRKIKSLDSLILDLQELVERQQEKSQPAAMAVAKRQRMLESEKATIVRKPVTEIKRETKRFRQDVFKRRFRARAIKRQCSPTSSQQNQA